MNWIRHSRITREKLLFFLFHEHSLCTNKSLTWYQASTGKDTTALFLPSFYCNFKVLVGDEDSSNSLNTGEIKVDPSNLYYINTHHNYEEWTHSIRLSHGKAKV